MLKFIKKLTVLLLLIPSYCAYAELMCVKIKGGFDFKAGYIKSNASEKAKPLTENQKNMAFSTSAYLAVDASNKLDSGFLYGAQIAITPTTSTSRKIRSGIYMEADFGRLELGSDQSAVTKMRISPLSIASASGGLWDVWVSGDPSIPYIMNYSNFLDGKMRLAGKTEFSRKITYYTPEYEGLQLGISYIPDTSNVGYGDLKHDVKHTPLSSKYTYSVRNGLGVGLTYKKDFDKNFYSKISLVGETGKAIATPKKGTQAPNIKPRRLKSYHVGAEITRDEYSIAASYANHLRSFSGLTDKRADTAIYGIGGRYKKDKFSSSLTYFASIHRSNKIQAVTLAADYKMAPGLMPYAEATYFQAKGSEIDNPDSKANHKGNLFLIGTKIEF